jgi:FKBP-type peptidyl-prolyl cis-trans isomerase FklB
VKIAVPFILGLTLLAGMAHAQGPVSTAPPVELADRAVIEGQEFLTRNAADPTVTTLPSGLQYKVIRAAAAGAPSPKVGDAIKVHYEGKLLNGQVFDSTYERQKPLLMMLEDLIPAWVEALPLMKVGDEWVIYAPPSLAYGERGVGPIPANSVLTFRLELLGMLSAE